MSDYEYQDYLGGRSFSSKQIDVDEDNVDVDAVGDNENENNVDDEHDGPSAGPTWFDWLRTGKYALEFILKAIEKRPQ